MHLKMLINKRNQINSMHLRQKSHFNKAAIALLIIRSSVLLIRFRPQNAHADT